MLLHRKWLWIVALLWASNGAAQDSGCAALARTPLEQAYCKIRAANPGAVLPSLQELRRNPEKTQRLLLRRPAEQAGISLPPESAPAKARPAPSPATAAVKPTTSSAKNMAEPVLEESNSLAGCNLAGTSIRCRSSATRAPANGATVSPVGPKPVASTTFGCPGSASNNGVSNSKSRL